MATSIIGGSSSTPTPREREAVKFFTLNAKYSIDPESTTEDIGDDIDCLHDTLEEVIQSIIEGTESQRHIQTRAFAALYFTRQVAAVAFEYVMRTRNAAKPCDEAPVTAEAVRPKPVDAPGNTLLIDALKSASSALESARSRARSVIAILERIEFAAAVASHGDADYDLVLPVDSMLAQLRDDAEAESDKLHDLLRRVDASAGEPQ